MKKLKKSDIGRGGDAGKVFIAARKIVGNGKITANGGGGCIGGRGGKITIISEDSQFKGDISARGGKLIYFSKKWWEKTWVQIIMLLGALAGIIGLLFIFKK